MDTHLKELIDLLERCAGPDRELDILIGYAVDLRGDDKYLSFRTSFDTCGMEMMLRMAESHQNIWRTELPRYTKSIDAAMTLVPEGMEKDFTDLYGVARASVGINANPGPFYGTHEGGSLAIALCIAALKAQLSTRTNEQDDARNLSGVSSE